MIKSHRRIFKILRMSLDLGLVVAIYALLRGGASAGFNPFKQEFRIRDLGITVPIRGHGCSVSTRCSTSAP